MCQIFFYVSQFEIILGLKAGLEGTTKILHKIVEMVDNTETWAEVHHSFLFNETSGSGKEEKT